jgi:hypothetical protein
VLRSISVLIAISSAASGFSSYTVRLYMHNATTGADNAGVLQARPGDSVEIWYQFDALDSQQPFKWGLLRITLCLNALTLMGSADSSSWSDQILAARSIGGPASEFLTTVVHDTDDGPLYDNDLDPTDSTYHLIANRGLFTLLGIKNSQPRGSHWTARLFQFTVQPGSEGEKLPWCLDGRATANGLSTSMLDSASSTRDITDQSYLLIVPEPAALTIAVPCLVFGLRKSLRKLVEIR